MVKRNGLLRVKFCILLLCICTIGLPVPNKAWADIDTQPLILVKSTKSMQRLLQDLKEAITNNNYVFIRQQAIDSRLTDVSNENTRVILVYFCNFNMLDRALKVDNRVGVFLPCKITLIQKPGYIELIAINPKLISKRLNEKRLDDICDRLTRDYHKILEDALI